MAVRQSSMFKFIQRSERPTSHHTDVTEEFTARCDSGLPPAKAVTLTDIANYASFDARCRLTSDQRFQMLTNRYTPPPNFQFPGTADKRGSQRRFQPSWLQRYSWLQYSVQADGGFCVPCMLFGVGRDGVDLGVLVSKPLTNFKKALEELKAHDIRNTHVEAVTRTDHFMKVMQGQREPVHHQINAALADRVAANRQRLVPIVKTVLLCGRQNFALRSPHDSAKQTKADPGINHGNFRALLEFRIDAGDSHLKDHLSTAPANATYTSARIQNELINIIGDLIREQIIDRVTDSRFYSVIADEVTDSANKEQLSLVLRYLNPETGKIAEDLVDFAECDMGITGQAVAEKILHLLQKFNLDPTLLRGQGYDGASNMAGKTRGAAAIITAQYPLALYVHCASHQLNLAVVKSAEVTSVRNMMGTSKKLHDFFYVHPKRQQQIESAIEESQPESRQRKVKDLSRTRWIARLEALETLCTLYPSLVLCMETIQDESHRWSTDSLTDARSLLLAITCPEFIASLVITQRVLSYTTGITRSLQAQSRDIIEAVDHIDTLRNTLQSVRDNVDEHHRNWIRDVDKMCSEVGSELSIPRRCSKQRHRDNTPAQTASDYYKRVITIPLLDHVLSELNSRFATHQVKAMQGLCLVPAALVTLTPDEAQAKVASLVNIYKDDLPSPGSMQSEAHCWQVKWRTELDAAGPDNLPKTPSAALAHANKHLFPNIRTLLSILCVLPVTTCSSERNSTLKLVKNRLRSTMGNERLTSLILMSVHRDIAVDPEKVISEFARRNARKMELLNILTEC